MVTEKTFVLVCRTLSHICLTAAKSWLEQGNEFLIIWNTSQLNFLAVCVSVQSRGAEIKFSRQTHIIFSNLSCIQVSESKYKFSLNLNCSKRIRSEKPPGKQVKKQSVSKIFLTFHCLIILFSFFFANSWHSSQFSKVFHGHQNIFFLTLGQKKKIYAGPQGPSI